jgi:peroxiredoxin
LENLLLWTLLVAIVLIVSIVLALWKKAGGRPVPQQLKAGQPLPQFQAVDEDGNQVSSADLGGAPAIMLFVRGSWCPFCSRQVASLTKVYNEITDSGARLILITPKPLETTRRVAEMFGVEFDFWLDDSLRVAKQLGLVLEAGVPDKQQNEYGEDTLWPTSLVIDANGVIRYTELSKVLVDRPNPHKLLSVVRSL